MRERERMRKSRIDRGMERQREMESQIDKERERDGGRQFDRI